VDAATICLLTGKAFYLYRTGRFDLLRRKPVDLVAVPPQLELEKAFR
jgi:hypothetical protein